MEVRKYEMAVRENDSPISLTKAKRKPKPTYVYEIFQKQQLHNKRLKKINDKLKMER